MNVRIINIQDNTTSHHPKRITRLNTDNYFYSPLSVQTRISAGSFSSSKNGYNLNFFNKEKAKRHFNLNLNANSNANVNHNQHSSNSNSNLRRRNRTPSKTSTSQEKHMSSNPLSIRITKVIGNNKKKSRSKQSFQSPARCSNLNFYHNMKKEKETPYTYTDNEKGKSKEKGRESIRLQLNRIDKKPLKPLQQQGQQQQQNAIEPKRIIRVKDSDDNFIQQNSKVISNKEEETKPIEDRGQIGGKTNIKTKKKKPCIFANEIPDSIRKKMIVYYQANTINYNIETQDNNRMNNNNNQHNSNHHFQRCNIISNTEGNRAIVRKNLGQVNNEDDDNEDIEVMQRQRQSKFDTNLNTYANANGLGNVNNSNTHKGLSISTQIVSINSLRAASKNKYRDLISQYMSEEEND